MLILTAVVLGIIFILRKRINRLFMFSVIIQKILQHEGGYVNDPDDLGGETKYGITARRYPDLDIKNLTRAEAIEIYRRDFYIPMGIGKMTNINLALNYMDMGVNAGIKNATTLLNEAKTIVAANPDKDIVAVYKDLRREYYRKVATYRNNQKFLAGWLNRVESSNIA